MNQPKKIIIADDDPGILDAIEIMLNYEGYIVNTTLNGATLLDIEDNFPDLILLDIWMSGTDGIDICKKLKVKPSMKNIPVILISASQDIEKSASEAGADDFLAKPFDINELLTKISKYTS
jgi:DNA-binding response OmpR family regulator